MYCVTEYIQIILHFAPKQFLVETCTIVRRNSKSRPKWFKVQSMVQTHFWLVAYMDDEFYGWQKQGN